MANALYLFCLTRGRLVPYLEAAGINGDDILILKSFSDITAVVCEVPEEDFLGSSAELKLQDLEWIGPRAVRHEQVVEEVMRYSPVLPAPFGSLFSSVETLENLIESNMSAINRFFDYVADKDEWSVKGLVSKDKALDNIFLEKMGRALDDLSSLTPGVRYFRERQLRSEAERELGGMIRQVCNTVGNELTGLSSSSRKRKIVSLSKEGNEKQTVVNWAFLVEDSMVKDFLARIEFANTECDPKGLVFECSGPWPPYSFCPSLEMEPRA